MQHKGEILEAVVRKKHKNLTALAEAMGYDRAALYRHFSKPDLEDGIILKYAKVLKYNFNYEFPELGQFTQTLNEPLADYTPITLSEALKEIDGWRDKYIDLLERHNALLKTMVDENKIR